MEKNKGKPTEEPETERLICEPDVSFSVQSIHRSFQDGMMADKGVDAEAWGRAYDYLQANTDSVMVKRKKKRVAVSSDSSGVDGDDDQGFRIVRSKKSKTTRRPETTAHSSGLHKSSEFKSAGVAAQSTPRKRLVIATKKVAPSIQLVNSFGPLENEGAMDVNEASANESTRSEDETGNGKALNDSAAHSRNRSAANPSAAAVVAAAKADDNEADTKQKSSTDARQVRMFRVIIKIILTARPNQ